MSRKKQSSQAKEKNRSMKYVSQKKAKSKKLKQIGEKVREDVDNINANFKNLYEEMVCCSKTSVEEKGNKTITLQPSKQQESDPVTEVEIDDFTEKLTGL